MRINVTQM
jgi:hypothetical protein